MKKIVIEIEDCWSCPFGYVENYERNGKLFCIKKGEKEVDRNLKEKEYKENILFPIPDWCPQIVSDDKFFEVRFTSSYPPYTQSHIVSRAPSREIALDRFWATRSKDNYEQVYAIEL